MGLGASIDSTSPIAPSAISSLALAKDGCVVVIDPQLSGTPASAQVVDHAVGLLEGVAHGLFGHDALRTALDGEAGQVGAVLDVRAHGDDVGPLGAEHQRGVGVDGVDAVALPERPETLLVPVGGGHELHVRPVPDRLRVAAGYALGAGMVVVMEPAVEIELGRRAVDVVDLEAVPQAVGEVVQQPHPAEADQPRLDTWPSVSPGL